MLASSTYCEGMMERRKQQQGKKNKGEKEKEKEVDRLDSMEVGKGGTKRRVKSSFVRFL